MRGTDTPVDRAAARILVELCEARAVLDERDWLRLCLDVLVHVSNADAAVLAAESPSGPLACGMSPALASDVAAAVQHSDDTEIAARCHVLATLSLAHIHESAATIALCSTGTADSQLDLDAVTIVTSPLLAMIADTTIHHREVA